MKRDFSEERDENVLNKIHEGMEVYDSDNEHIGEVEFVYLGGVSPEEGTQAAGPVTFTHSNLPGDDPFLVDFAFGGGVSPSEVDENEVVRNRLMSEGFLRVEGNGLFQRDRYVTPKQIASVTEERVVLTVSRDDLIRS